MEIDIKPKNTDRLRENEISSLFTSQNSYSKIMGRETIFIIGPRGTGKSMILRYMSMPIQSERQKSNIIESYDKDHCGIYINCSKHYFGQIKEKPNLNVQQTNIWKENFVHMFNLTICHILFECIDDLREYPVFQMTKLEEEATCKKISVVLGCDEICSFEHMCNEVRKKMRHLYANFDIKITDTATVFSFISELEENLNKKISGFRNRSLCILLDNYNELTDMQRNLINEMISLRTSFKIATLPPKVSTARELDKFISPTDDFETVYIGTTNLSIKSPEFSTTKCFLKNVANKRLKEYGLDVEILLNANDVKDLKNKTDYFGFENFVLLSSGNARMFLRLLNTAIREWSNIGKSIPVKVQQKAAHELAYELMTQDMEFLPKQYRSKTRSLISKLGLLFKNYRRIIKKDYLQIGITDSENITEDTYDLLSLARERNYIMQPPVNRESRKGLKLESITLLNALLPYFELPLKTHQVCEISAEQFNILIKKDSVINGIKVTLGTKKISMEPAKTLFPYMKQENNSNIEHSELRITKTREMQEIVQHASNKELGIFIGAGLSIEIGYPSGSYLAEKIARWVNTDYVGEDLTTVVERVLQRLNKGDLVKFIKNEFKSIEEKESMSYAKLADLKLDEIFTTNWDNSLENVFKKLHRDTEVIVIDEHIPMAGSRKPLIYKLHGGFEYPDKFVITENDYDDVEKTRPAIINALKDTLARKHFLFLGYSIDDPDLLRIFDWICKVQGTVPLTSYVAILNSSKEKEKDLKKMNIITLDVKGETLINAIHQEIMGKLL